MTATCYKGDKSIMKNLIIIIKIKFVYSKKISLIGHILDYMLDHVLNYMLNYMIIGLVTMELQRIKDLKMAFSYFKDIFNYI